MSSRLIVRLTAPLVGVSLLLLTSGVLAAWYVQHLQRTVADVLLINISSMRAAEEVEILIRETRTQLDSFLITGDRKYLQKNQQQCEETQRWLRVAERSSVTSHEKNLTQQAGLGYQHFLQELDDLSRPIDPESLRSRVRTLIDKVLVGEVLRPTHSYLDYNEEEVEKSVEQNKTLADWLGTGFLCLGISGCVAGLLAGFAIARGIKRSLIQLSIPIRAAAGQLDAIVGPISFNPGTDLNHLQEVLNSLAERTSEVVQRLRQSEREVLRSEQLAAVGQMAAGMAHELRNPLTSMKLLVQSALVRESLGKESATLGGRDLGVLEEEINRLETLTHTFLQFARPPLPDKRQVGIQPLITETVALLAPRAELCLVRVDAQLPAEPINALIDPSQVRQVLLNLLLNAFDAVVEAHGESSAERRVTIRLETDMSKARVRLLVSDTGCGLPSGLGTQIFAPFVTTKESGLGLGLSICKRIVEAHHGSIEGANLPEGGAVFTVTLPLLDSTE